MSNSLSIRIGIESDIDGIIALQAQNLYANLSAAELAGGFVTTPFTPELIRRLFAQTGVFVAEIDRQIVGYVLAGDWDFFSQWEIFRVITSRLPNLKFQGMNIEVEQSFQYGPVCIDRTLRGSGILSDLFAKMRSSFAPKFPVGITFINRLNQRSLMAHTRKLDLEIIDEFELNGNSFYTLAFSTTKFL
jgi:hypothetical protein